jgi:hypothetical protein
MGSKITTLKAKVLHPNFLRGQNFSPKNEISDQKNLRSIFFWPVLPFVYILDVQDQTVCHIL